MNAGTRTTWSERLLRRLVAGGSRRRALAGFAALSVGDFFVPALPTQTAVIALSLLQPRRAVWIVLGFALASGLGTALMAALVASIDGYAQALASDISPAAWARATDLLLRHGVWIVLLASLLPTPPRTLVVAALLAGVPAVTVVSAVTTGKALWFGGLVALLVQMPQRLRQTPWLGQRIRYLEALRAATAGEGR